MGFTEKLKIFLKKESTIVVGLFLLAYILRTLPYLLGYSIPFTDDGIYDFSQVKFLIENHSINFNDNNGVYYFGAFPVLHLLVYGISQLGFDPLKVFLFVPQIFPSLGLIFFYLFLRKYFPIKQSLLAIFLIAIFGPHIHWSAQPVRETMGLFFYPMIIYFFDKVFENFDSTKKKLFCYLGLLVSLILIIPSHHWSTLMVMFWMIVYALVFVEDRKKRQYALGITALFILAGFVYWFFAFIFAYFIINQLINFSILIPIIIIAVAVGLVYFKKSNFDLNTIKNKIEARVSFVVLVFILLIIGSNFLAVSYPVQIWFPVLIYLLFFVVGFFSTKSQNVNELMLFHVIYLGLILVAFVYFLYGYTIYEMPFDLLRILEFMIFPMSIVSAYGFYKLKNRFPIIFILTLVLLTIFATMIYPSVFVYGKKFEDTAFYDIRSDVRHVSDSSLELIAWAHAQGFSIYSPRPEVKMYDKVFYTPQKISLALISESELNLKTLFDLIKDPIIKVEDPEKWDFFSIQYDFILIKNNQDYLVLPKAYVNNFSSDIVENKLFGDLNTFLYLGSDEEDKYKSFDVVGFSQVDELEVVFFDSEILKVFSPPNLYFGQKQNMSITIKNTGSATWNKSDPIKYSTNFGTPNLPLPHDVLPGQVVELFYISITEDKTSHLNLHSIGQLYYEGLGAFGDSYELFVNINP